MLDFFKCISLKQGHQGEIVALHFNTEGDKLITASFDNTARVYYFTQIWDVQSGECIRILEDH